MSGKTISTSTLSLKFMQNAHRAKNLKEVEAERAEVQDEAEWEVPGARSAFSVSQTISTTTHEASYLPFLFDAQTETSTSASRPKGRRVFGKKGVEVDKPEAEHDAPADPAPPAPSAGASKIRAPPRVSPLSAREPRVRKDQRTARQLIRDTSGVGADLRARAPAPTQPQGFMKPAGVDEPAPASAGRGVPDSGNGDDDEREADDVIVLGGRGKAKRRRGANADQRQDDAGAGRKRKKSGGA